MELKPFDPADYLDSEEGIEAYLADARQFGAEAMADAEIVIARARARMSDALRKRQGVSEAPAAFRDRD